MINKIILFALRRKLFKGQFRLFLWLYNNHYLKIISTIGKPITGKFNIKLNTKNYIDACIYYTGDYEPYLKFHFKNIIKTGDVVLDIGANIGFHTLYFAELTGESGKVFAFEPIPINFNALENNIRLNSFTQIVSVNKALGNSNSLMDIHINDHDQNPGAFNLLEVGIKNTTIECVKGDDFLTSQNINRIDFIKVDVEGFESEVFKGLSKTIRKFRPIIVFEYDKNYQSKTNEDPKEIFYFLSDLNYEFLAIDGYGKKKKISISDNLISSEILAYPTNNN